MKKRSVFVIIIGLAFFYAFFYDPYNNDMGTLFLGILILLVAIVFSVYSLYKDISDYIKTKLISSFTTTFIGILIALIIMIYNYTTDVSRIPIVLYATHDGGSNSCGITLRNNGKYEFYNGSALGMSQVEGKYSLKDSIITIEKPKLKDDKANINLVIKENRLLIKSTLFKYDNDTITHVVYQIDKNDKILDSAITFVVFQDKRIKK